MARDDLIQIKGTIVEALAGGNYRVKGDNGMEFLAKIGGLSLVSDDAGTPFAVVVIPVDEFLDHLPAPLDGVRAERDQLDLGVLALGGHTGVEGALHGR